MLKYGALRIETKADRRFSDFTKIFPFKYSRFKIEYMSKGFIKKRVMMSINVCMASFDYFYGLYHIVLQTP